MATIRTNWKTLALNAGLMLLVACKPPLENMQPDRKTAQTPAERIALPPQSKGTTLSDLRGFGLAGFGDSEQKFRKANPQAMQATKPVEGSSCFYLFPEQQADAKNGIAYMFEQDKFVRVDVRDANQTAPENIRVGDDAADVRAKFFGRFEQAPHKYIENGLTLTIAPNDKTAAYLVFEMDANGKVISWRLGVAPQVFYVEGCS